MSDTLKLCFRKPIPEIYEAAQYLDDAITAHLAGDRQAAEALIKRADIPAIREWTESIWGKGSPYVKFRETPDSPAKLAKEQRVKVRMPNKSEKEMLHQRDGYHCRFCNVPVIRKEVREELKRAYPDALPWGKKNTEQHAAFQAMWLQYDHVLPHARGGNNDLNNIVITCGPCNFGRMDSLMEEVGIADPRERPPIKSEWDGLERVFDK